MVRRSFITATAFLWVAVFLSYAAGQPLNVGLVPDGISRTTAQDKAPLIAYLAKSMGREVNIRQEGYIGSCIL